MRSTFRAGFRPKEFRGYLEEMTFLPGARALQFNPVILPIRFGVFAEGKDTPYPRRRSQRAQSSAISNCSRSDIGWRLSAGANPVADPGPGGQLLAKAPVIPALRVPARELARRPGEPAAAERHPGRGASTAPGIPRDPDAVDAASGPEHPGDHSRAQFRHQ